MVFLEALRQFQFQVGKENILFIHVSLVPVMGTIGEQKTKPTQHSVKVITTTTAANTAAITAGTSSTIPTKLLYQSVVNTELYHNNPTTHRFHIIMIIILSFIMIFRNYVRWAYLRM